MSRQSCEIKSVRENVISELTSTMSLEDKFQDVANLFKLLGDYNRVRIIFALSYGELCVCELSLLLDMSQSAISHQLRLLRNNDIVKFRKEDKRTYYSLQNDDIISIIKKVGEYEL